MEHKELKSSNIQSAAHEDGITEVTYRSGKTYQYQDPTGEAHATLMKAKSVGSAMHKLKSTLPFRVKGEKEWRKP